MTLSWSGGTDDMKTQNAKHKTQKTLAYAMGSGGFTIIELLIVAAIIAALLAILVPTLGGVRQKAAEAQASALLGTIQTGLQQYYSDFNMYPPSAPVYGGITSGRGSAMLAQGLMGYLGYAADGAGPDNPSGADPQYGFRTKRAGAGMGGGAGGEIRGPYVPPDPKTFQGSGATQYFVDPWGNEILYFRSTRSGASAATTPLTVIFGTIGDTGYYFDYGDCSSVPNFGAAPSAALVKPPGAPTAGFFAKIGAVDLKNVPAKPNSLINASYAVMGAGSYLLVSAGSDGKYFTDDDIVVGK
jgi:prepilin-type N-terminal cleavage/methylation domain-containing protein